jgi:hypothetical protein
LPQGRQAKGGTITGYVKPLFQGVEVGRDGAAVAEKGFRQRLYEGLVGIGAKILKNRLRGEVHAFLRPITPGYEPARSPKGGPRGSGKNMSPS